MPKTPVPGARRPYAGLSHEARTAQRRQAFLDAAVRVFGSVGFHGATVKAVCAEAGLTDRYFYESFADTEHLLREAYAGVAEELLTRLKRSVARSRTRDAAIEASLKAYFSFVRRREAARVLLVEVLGVSPAVDRLYQHTNAAFAKAIVAPWLDAGVPLARGQGDARVLAIALTGAVNSAAVLWLLSDYRQPMARMVASCRQVLAGTLEHLGRRGG